MPSRRGMKPVRSMAFFVNGQKRSLGSPPKDFQQRVEKVWFIDLQHRSASLWRGMAHFVPRNEEIKTPSEQGGKTKLHEPR